MKPLNLLAHCLNKMRGVIVNLPLNPPWTRITFFSSNPSSTSEVEGSSTDFKALKLASQSPAADVPPKRYFQIENQHIYVR